MDKTTPAFPSGSIRKTRSAPGNDFFVSDTVDAKTMGMSLRDYFAAKIIGGILADSTVRMDGIDRKKALAELAYEMADAMISARCSD